MEVELLSPESNEETTTKLAKYDKILISTGRIPNTESLKDTYNRVLPYFKKEIQNKLDDNKNVLIAAHGNSIRAICKFLFQLDNKKITQLEIPTGNPLLINFNEKNKIIKCFYLDKERTKDLIVF